MKNFSIIAIAAAGVLSISACGPKAQNETAEAADAIAADANATMGEAVNDVDAATDQALGAAENTLDDAGNKIDSAKDSAGEDLKNVGNEIED